MNELSSLKPPLMRPRQESINSFTFSCLINNTVISKNIRSGHVASMSSSTDVFILPMWEREGWLVTQSTPACSVSISMVLFQVKTALNSNLCIMKGCLTEITHH